MGEQGGEAGSTEAPGPAARGCLGFGGRRQRAANDSIRSFVATFRAGKTRRKGRGALHPIISQPSSFFIRQGEQSEETNDGERSGRGGARGAEPHHPRRWREEKGGAKNGTACCMRRAHALRACACPRARLNNQCNPRAWKGARKKAMSNKGRCRWQGGGGARTGRIRINNTTKTQQEERGERGGGRGAGDGDNRK